MKKNIGIVLVIILIGLGAFFLNKSDQGTNLVEVCTYEDTLERDNCLLQTAKSAETPDLCRDIATEALKLECIHFLGATNETDCTATDNAVLESDCYLQLAYQENSPEICSSIAESELADECFYLYAREKQDQTACQLIQDQERQQLCSSLLSGDMSACQNLSEEEASSCYTNYAESEKNPNLCTRIINEEDRSACLQNYAFVHRSEQACLSIQPTDLQQICLQQLALLEQDPELCATLENSYRDNCYFDLGTNLPNIQLCDFIEEVNLRDVCQDPSYHQI